MSAFGAIVENHKVPGRTLKLEPWVFADGWDEKPTSAICVGIRLMADGDKQKARASAESIASELHPQPKTHDEIGNWIDAFNDALVRQVAALGICDPNDVRGNCELLPMAEEQVRYALTSTGARFIFDEINRYEIEVSVIEPQLASDQVPELCKRITEKFAHLDAGQRKMLAHVFTRLEG